VFSLHGCRVVDRLTQFFLGVVWRGPSTGRPHHMEVTLGRRTRLHGQASAGLGAGPRRFSACRTRAGAEAVLVKRRVEPGAFRVNAHLRIPSALVIRWPLRLRRGRCCFRARCRRNTGARRGGIRGSRPLPVSIGSTRSRWPLPLGSSTCLIEVEVFHLDAAHFRQARRGAPKHFKDGTVAEPDHRFTLGTASNRRISSGFNSTAGNRCGWRATSSCRSD